MKGKVEVLLSELGFALTPVADTHLCCGSAGTYNMLQPEIATRLRDRKLRTLRNTRPEALCQEFPHLVDFRALSCCQHLADISSAAVCREY